MHNKSEINHIVYITQQQRSYCQTTLAIIVYLWKLKQQNFNPWHKPKQQMFN